MGVLVDAVDDPTAGAVVTFCGQVRNHDDGRQVTAIDYEAHPDAGRVVEEIAEQVAQASGACRIAVLHRTGYLEVGGIALGAAVSAPHRAEAFRLLEAVIEQVKMKLPVWKRQHFADGSQEWTGVA
jgi:molybdopterin synthase catalytic subunit